MYIAENDRLRLAVSEVGAEMRKLTRKDNGEELLWESDPAVWSGCAPWLFPVIGQMKDGGYTHGGVKYRMPMHGFARKMPFQAEALGADCLRFTLRDTEDTRRIYPWRFEFSVTYRLEGARLNVECQVKNLDESPMLFSLGAHPGFACQAGDELDFGKVNGLTYRRLEAGSHLLKAEKESLALPGGRLRLESGLFEDDAILLEAPAIGEITVRKANGADVRLTFDSVPWVGVWTKPLKSGPRYICLEPWLGVDDPVDADGELSHKKDIQTIRPGGQAPFSLAIECLE